MQTSPPLSGSVWVLNTKQGIGPGNVVLSDAHHVSRRSLCVEGANRYLDDILHLLLLGAFQVLEVLQRVGEVFPVEQHVTTLRRSPETSPNMFLHDNMSLRNTGPMGGGQRWGCARAHGMWGTRGFGAGLPVFLYTLFAVGNVFVDLHQLRLQHHPVRLQPREHVHKVRFRLCSPKPPPSAQPATIHQQRPSGHAQPFREHTCKTLALIRTRATECTVHSCCCPPLNPVPPESSEEQPSVLRRLRDAPFSAWVTSHQSSTGIDGEVGTGKSQCSLSPEERERRGRDRDLQQREILNSFELTKPVGPLQVCTLRFVTCSSRRKFENGWDRLGWKLLGRVALRCVALLAGNVYSESLSPISCICRADACANLTVVARRVNPSFLILPGGRRRRTGSSCGFSIAGAPNLRGGNGRASA